MRQLGRTLTAATARSSKHRVNAATDSAITTPSMFATPQTYADPAATVVPWGEWISASNVNIPQVDTTVHQSR